MAKKPPSRKPAAKSPDKLKIGKRTLKDLQVRKEDVKGGAWPTVYVGCSEVSRTLLACPSK